MNYYLILIKKYQTGSSSEYAGNEFDLTLSCPLCRTGARVINPHKLRNIEGSYSKDIFQTNTRDYFISERLYNYLRDSKSFVSDFLTTVNQKNLRLPFYQLTSSKTMPKALKCNGFIQYDDHCNICRRDNYSRAAKPGDPLLNLPFTAEDIEYIYSNGDQKFLTGMDVISTWECTARSVLDNNGLIKVLPKPMLIASQKFKDALTNFGVDNVEFWKVKFE